MHTCLLILFCSIVKMRVQATDIYFFKKRKFDYIAIFKIVHEYVCTKKFHLFGETWKVISEENSVSIIWNYWVYWLPYSEDLVVTMIKVVQTKYTSSIICSCYGTSFYASWIFLFVLSVLLLYASERQQAFICWVNSYIL